MSFKDEFEMNMRLLGAKAIQDVVPAMVDTSNIKSHAATVPGDRLYDRNCKSFIFARFTSLYKFL
jgi:L-lactate dehydrogenase (cytochrome)